MEFTKITAFPKKITTTVSQAKSLILFAVEAGTLAAQLGERKLIRLWEVTNPAANLYYAGLSMLAFAALVFGGYIYTRPYTYVNSDEAAIVCRNSKIYSAKENNIGDLDALYAYLRGETGPLGQKMRSEDVKARKLCAYGIINDFFPYRKTPSEINYEVRLASPFASFPPAKERALLFSS